MCIIVYKPKGKEMPSRDTLMACFTSNPDGAGYMFPKQGKVEIEKGFMSFEPFYKMLMQDYEENKGKDIDFVMHFRIGTQGGVNAQCCHPFPVSNDMEDLYKLVSRPNVGLAHNGIISLTTESTYDYYYDSTGIRHYRKPELEYSDTMKFVTDYVSLIIKNKDWYKDSTNKELIEKLAEKGYTNKFAIMSGDGHTELLGPFIESDGIYYSNYTFQTHTHYQTTKPIKETKSVNAKPNIDDYEDLNEYFDDLEEYNALYGDDEDDALILRDYSQTAECMSMPACRRCVRFEECYGFDIPPEWEDLDDDEFEDMLYETMGWGVID